MSIKHTVNVRLLDENRKPIRETLYREEEIRRIGGVGAIVGALEPMCSGGEIIEVRPHYHQ
jgi:hypothetical protein